MTQTPDSNREEKRALNFRRTVFLGSFADPAARPPGDGPTVLIAGKSNVGKSSLINALTGGRLARVSSTPGKTRLLNRYRIDDALTLIDLPGYGYAKTAASERERFSKMTEQFLSSEPKPDLVLLLLDARHDPTELDRLMIAWLESSGVDWIAVLTKADKISRADANRRCRQVADAYDQRGGGRPLAVSAEKRRGIVELRQAVAGRFGYGVVATD